MLFRSEEQVDDLVRPYAEEDVLGGGNVAEVADKGLEREVGRRGVAVELEVVERSCGGNDGIRTAREHNEDTSAPSPSSPPAVGGSEWPSAFSLASRRMPSE